MSREIDPDVYRLLIALLRSGDHHRVSHREEFVVVGGHVERAA